jgi:hypothetical protein
VLHLIDGCVDIFIFNTMLSFQHLSVRARLSIAFGTLLFLLLAIATLAIVQLSLANQRFDGFVHGIQARTLLAATVRTEVLGRGVGVRNMALATAPETITKEKALTEAAHARGTKALGELLQMVQAPEVDAATRQLAEHIGTVEKRYAPVALRIVALAEQGQRDEAIAQINEECSPLLLELVAAANAYVEKSQQNAEVQVRNAQKIYSNQRSILLTISLLSLALALAAGIWIVRSLMTDLGADPHTLRKLVGNVTQGDLTRAIRIRPDDSSSVLAAVAQMQQGLIDMVTSVRQPAEAVSSAAEQISSGNADLSARTEAQASTLEQACELIDWYRARWEIELFFLVLKEGCRVERLQLGDSERLQTALALYMVIAWRINRLMRLGRALADLPADLVFESDEWKAAFILNKKPVPKQVPELNTVIRLIAQRGGFLARKGDGQPGAKSIWLGMQDVAVFVEGIRYARQAGGI